jgi:hypothetical protein
VLSRELALKKAACAAKVNNRNNHGITLRRKIATQTKKGRTEPTTYCTLPASGHQRVFQRATAASFNSRAQNNSDEDREGKLCACNLQPTRVAQAARGIGVLEVNRSLVIQSYNPIESPESAEDKHANVDPSPDASVMRFPSLSNGPPLTGAIRLRKLYSSNCLATYEDLDQ